MTGIIILLLLNFLLFLPRYFFNRQTDTFFPYKELFKNRKTIYLRALASRFNNDVFRVVPEWVVLNALGCLCSSMVSSKLIGVVLFMFYNFCLILFTYHYGILSIYKTFPALSTDSSLLKQGYAIAVKGYKKEVTLGWIAFFILELCLGCAIWLLVSDFTKNTELILGFCVLLFLSSVVFFSAKKISVFNFKGGYDFHYLTYATVQSVIFTINANRFYSRKAKKELALLPSLSEDSFYPKQNIPELAVKPNICFIALESYGAILYENELFRHSYVQQLSAIETTLRAKGWESAGKLMQSPVSGGGSWMAFSSLLKGIAIHSEALYRNLLQQQHNYPTESVMDVFSGLGYDTWLTAAIGGFETLVIPWKETLDFMGTKNLIRYHDLEYSGVRFNMGPSAPDQYMLNKSLELIRKKQKDKPYVFFTETINSHVKFHSPTVVFNDWMYCNTATVEEFCATEVSDKLLVENYRKAISYQLSVIEQLIAAEQENTLFVIFGDHQPALITSHNHSFNTPVHIFSKNENLITALVEQGFEKGLIYSKEKSNPNPFYEFKAAFLKSFFKTYKVPF